MFTYIYIYITLKLFSSSITNLGSASADTCVIPEIGEHKLPQGMNFNDWFQGIQGVFSAHAQSSHEKAAIEDEQMTL